MILSGRLIKEVLSSGVWKCNTPHSSLTVGPNSVDVTLCKTILVPNFGDNEHYTKILDPIANKIYCRSPHGNSEYDLSERDLFSEKTISSEGFVLAPGKFILASVNESFDCQNPIYDGRIFAPMYEGRSTLARIGLLSHISAAFGDYGFKGSFTLEMVNLSPWSIKITPDMRIGQVYFQEVYNRGELFPIEDVYDGYDQRDCKPQAPRLGNGRFN